MIIAIAPDYGLCQTLAIPGGLPTNELHTTVLYIDEAFMTPEELYTISNILQFEAFSTTIFEASAVSLSRFEKVRSAWGPNGSYVPTEDTDAVTLTIDSPALHDCRDRLIQQLDTYNINYSKAFKEFKPHITLKYVPHGEVVELPYELPQPFFVRFLGLWTDAAHTTYPLAGR